MGKEDCMLSIIQVFIKEQGINHWMVAPLIVLVIDISNKGRSLFLGVEWRYNVCFGGAIIMNFIKRMEYKDVNKIAININM